MDYDDFEPEVDVAYIRRLNDSEPSGLEKLRELSRSSDLSVRLEVAKNWWAPKDALELLSYSPEVEVLCAVAENANTPEAVILRLVEEGNPEVLESLARRSRMENYLAWYLVHLNNEEVTVNLASNYDTPPYILKRLSEHESPEVVRMVAKNSKTPNSVLKRFINADPEHVYRYFCNCPKCTTLHNCWLNKSLHGLYHKEFLKLREWFYNSEAEKKTEIASAIADISTKISLAETIEAAWVMLDDLKDFDSFSNVQASIAANRNTPEDILKELVEDPSSHLRKLVAENEGAPMSVLEIVYKRGDYTPLLRNRSFPTIRKMDVNFLRKVGSIFDLHMFIEYDVVEYFRSKENYAVDENGLKEYYTALVYDNITNEIGRALIDSKSSWNTLGDTEKTFLVLQFGVQTEGNSLR